MSNREKIDEYYGIEFLYADGFDAAIIGVEFYTKKLSIVLRSVLRYLSSKT